MSFLKNRTIKPTQPRHQGRKEISLNMGLGKKNPRYQRAGYLTHRMGEKPNNKKYFGYAFLFQKTRKNTNESTRQKQDKS